MLLLLLELVVKRVSTADWRSCWAVPLSLLLLHCMCTITAHTQSLIVGNFEFHGSHVPGGQLLE